MPNHVTNIITFGGNEDVTPVLEFIKYDEGNFIGSFDFNKLIPMPESLNIAHSSKGDAGYKAYCEYIESNRQSCEFYASLLDKYSITQDDFELGKTYYNNLKEYGSVSWYGWSIDNWGTKWNAYDCLEVTPEDRFIQFLTAWSPVPKVIEALSKSFPKIPMTYQYADEDIGYNVGEIKYLGGEVLEVRFPDGGSEEAIQMAMSIMGLDPDDYEE